VLNNGNYDGEFTGKIYQLVKNSEEYSAWESRWNKVRC